MTGTQGAAAGEPAPRRTRGKTKAGRNWRRDPDAPTAVVRLELDPDEATRVRVEAMYETVFRLRRAVQHDAQDRARAYWAAPRLRAEDPRGARTHVGLGREAFEQAAYRHLDAAPWMRDHVTKAVAMHVADEVWTTVERHLFGDTSGRRSGPPRVGGWWDFTRVPGRAKSHTKPNKWETFRLVGTLPAHRAAYPPAPAPSGGLDARTALSQPKHLPLPTRPAPPPEPDTPKRPRRKKTRQPTQAQPEQTKQPSGWWAYDGPLAVVFTGLPKGDLALPVRLPQGAGQQARLEHFLADPAAWHKVDLVRVRDRRAPGGWRYYAHLMVLKTGWSSPSVRVARAAAPRDRLAGVDGNVSKLAVVSMPADPSPRRDVGALRSSYVAVPEPQRAKAADAALLARRRSGALDRSRRAANPDQYELSRRQARRAARLDAEGRKAPTVQVPMGPRKADKAGIPAQAYRKDSLSQTYRATRAAMAAAARSTAQAKHARARSVAREIVAAHGPTLVVEACDMRAWARRWGKAQAVFTPGRFVAALDAEARAAGGALLRAGTRDTALSQRCCCGARVPKTLADRDHACPECGLVADRDLMSAALAACVTLTDPADPRTARVGPMLSAALARRLRTTGQQEALARPTDRPRPDAAASRPGRGHRGAPTPPSRRGPHRARTLHDAPHRTTEPPPAASPAHASGTPRPPGRATSHAAA